MSENRKPTQQPPFVGASSSARPHASTVRFVEKWLFESEFRETDGCPWTGDYVRDAARMIEDAIARSPNAE